jgi:large subunit ribosomal protein L11
METINLMVDGGDAKAGAQMGTTLGPLGVNISQIINDINEKTKGFKGIQVPVKLEVNPKTKEYTITVGTPPVSQLIKAKLNLEKGSGNTGNEVVGDISLEDLKSIAKSKLDSNIALDEKAMLKQVVGTCVSMGVTVDGKSAKEVVKTI